ncbi:exocyst subunit [Xanthoria calcicola]
MSQLPNGNNAYVNGDHGSNHSYRDDSSAGGRNDHRPGGYAALNSNNPNLSFPPDREQGTTIAPLDDQSAGINTGYGYPRHRAADRNHAGGPGAVGSRVRDGPATYGNGPAGRQIEDVLNHINDTWAIMGNDKCVPVHVALQLMDHSSLGRGSDYQDFQRTSRHLQKALRSIVNEHHQGFNSSIGTFHKIQSSIQASQIRVRSLRDSVQNAKSSLMEAKPELQGLGASSQRYENMLRVLGQIEKLQALPELLDSHIADKHFLAAVDLLQDALRTIRRSELESISALSDLRVYFSIQETSLADIMVEELHDHLYLKAPQCRDRWKAYSSVSHPGERAPSSLPHAWGRPLYSFLNSLDVSTPAIDAASSTIKNESFPYIHMLLEALDRANCLDVAVDRIEHRLPVELFTIVDRTNQEVKIRHPARLRETGRLENALLAHDFHDAKRRSEILEDLLWTLYSKFEAVAEGHRVVHDVILGIARRNGLKKLGNLTGSFKELWKLYQSELRSLLHDYIAMDEDSLTKLGRPMPGDMNTLQKNHRNKSKRVFRLAEINQKTSNFATEQDDLDKMLQHSVPGLVSKSQIQSGIPHDQASMSKGGPATHTLLAESSVFNIALLLPPSLSFLQRLKEIVPPDSDIAISTLTSFLDDFLVNIFLPQLEETVTELCAETYMELNAFQKDPHWQQQAARPILKSTSDFFNLVKTFCRLLDSLPEDQSFTQPIITQIVAYYDICCGWYRSIVQRSSLQVPGDKELKPAAKMAEAGELRDILNAQWSQPDAKMSPETQKEVEYLVSKTKQAPFIPVDIISDGRAVASLCLLYTSMQWLASGLAELRHVGPHLQAPKRTSTRPQQVRRWTLLDLKIPHSEDEPIYLPMNQESAATFDGVIASVRSLALDALFTLQIDIRCGIAHMLGQLYNAPYSLPYPTNNPDPSVLALNSDLLSFDDALSSYLHDKDHRFITTGLASLVDTLLVTHAGNIGCMDANGCGRMQLNILVLQQNLKAIEGELQLSRSAHYFELFAEGADAVVARAQETSAEDSDFSVEEFKALVELCHSEALQSQQRESSMQARKKLTEHLRQLDEIER